MFVAFQILFYYGRVRVSRSSVAVEVRVQEMAGEAEGRYIHSGSQSRCAVSIAFNICTDVVTCGQRA